VVRFLSPVSCLCFYLCLSVFIRGSDSGCVAPGSMLA
jgi:hypothetical protein